MIEVYRSLMVVRDGCRLKRREGGWRKERRQWTTVGSGKGVKEVFGGRGYPQCGVNTRTPVTTPLRHDIITIFASMFNMVRLVLLNFMVIPTLKML